jgi:hypothetical protein
MAPLPSNILPIVARVGSAGNVFTESLPRNGSIRHNTFPQCALGIVLDYLSPTVRPSWRKYLRNTNCEAIWGPFCTILSHSKMTKTVMDACSNYINV